MARVLVVDDRPDSRELLIALLRYAGHDTLEARDGAEALRAVHGEHPDLVITDILMPGMDGYEFVRRLRADKDIEQPRVVFCTATYLSEQAKEIAAACGASRVIEKPSDPETILATVGEALAGAPNGSGLQDQETFDRIHLRLVNEKLLEKVTELETVNLERSKLLAGLVSAQENERARIAADIHDDSIQVMAAVALRLELLGEDLPESEQTEALRDIAQMVARAVGRLRRLIFDLSPQSLESGGLGGALDAFVREVAAEAGFSWRVDNGLTDELPEDTEIVLYRIAQEAIRNAQKHAQARSLVVTLVRTDGGTTLLVADDGVGFDPAEATRYRPGHLGLVSIRERATMAGGRFELYSSPGAGCVVEVWVPDSLATP